MKKICLAFFALLPLICFASSAHPILYHYQQPSKVPPPSPPPPKSCGYQMTKDLEFLYWFANVSNLDYAMKRSVRATGINVVVTPVEKMEFERSFDPGLRLGLGLKLPHDQWEVQSQWTYYYTSKEASDRGNDNVLTEGAVAFGSPWIYSPTRDRFAMVKAKTALLFNQIDLTLKKGFSLSKRFAQQFGWGIRGYWSRLFFETHLFRPFFSPDFFPRRQDSIDAYARQTQKAWGVGLLGQGKTTYWLSPQWGIFGEGGAALTYGKGFWKGFISQFQINSLPAQLGDPEVDLRYTTRENTYRLQSFLDLGMGIRLSEAVWRLCTAKLRNALGISLSLSFQSVAKRSFPTRAECRFIFFKRKPDPFRACVPWRY